MTRLFDDEPFAIRVLQGVDVAADALYQAAVTEFDRAQIEKLTSLFEGFAESAAGQWREIRHFIEAERVALERAESAERLLALAGAENARLNATVQEFQAHRCEARS